MGTTGGKRKEGMNLLETKIQGQMATRRGKEHQVLSQFGDPEQEQFENPKTQKNGWKQD